ncbi:MAG TPA: lipoate--protein ligase [Prolixibacteraceae bacterium]
MNLLISPSSNPYENLAVEEFLLKNSTEDFIFLYVNRPCVVVGKHQITPKEINSNYTFENNIVIVRRLSGGGTVFQDEGNLNFSVIQSITPGSDFSYKILSRPIIEFLRQVGANVHLSDRNDIMLFDKKISGSAMHIYKNRALAHSTLLIDCNLSTLSLSLQSNPERYKDKSIASIRSKVMNLSEAYNDFSVSYLLDLFTKFVGSEYQFTTIPSIPESYNFSISKLASEKYGTNEWIYGYSPKYTYKNTCEFNGNKIDYSLNIEKGIIISTHIESIIEQKNTIDLEFNQLIGKPHNITAFFVKNEITLSNDFHHFLINSLF